MVTTRDDSIPPGQTCPPWDIVNHEHSSSIVLVLMVGVVIGVVLVTTLLFVYMFYYRRATTRTNAASLAMAHAEDCRLRLPETIILIRHGESQANADKSMWIHMPDNLLGLTEKGREQAALAGLRVEEILQQDEQQNNNCACNNNKKTRSRGGVVVHLVVSPFERSLQTAAALRPALEHRIVRTDIESRIREQEMGNLQSDPKLFQQYRKEQERVGRFWYRFPTGESGSDVLDRVKSWWYESIQTVNTRVGYEPVQAIVVVSHGLTMRFMLMQLFGWSPTTFHSVWNAGNCQMYVLKKDLSKPGPSPYVLDKERGDVPRSSINVQVQLKQKQSSSSSDGGGSGGGETETITKSLTLKDYLSVPPPRTTQFDCIKYMLAEQYPEEIKDAEDITSIMFVPFVGGGIIKGRSSSGVECKRSSSSSLTDTTASPPPTSLVASSTTSTNGDVSASSSDHGETCDNALPSSSSSLSSNVQWAKREQSLRWSYFRVPNDKTSPNIKKL